MSSKFHYTLKKKGNVTYVSINGIIDEDNNLPELGEKIGSGTVIINLENVERINSCGVRDWVNWLSSIEKKGAEVVLYDCSPAIVAQINLVNNFTGNAVVKSFFAPYYCENCDKEKVLLIEAAAMKSQDELKAPISRCDECDEVMEFDDMEESYFAFIKNAKVGPMPKTLPEGWEDFLQIESTHTQDKRVKTRERTLRGKKVFTTSSSLPGSLPSSLPSLPTSSLPTLSTRDSRSSTFSSLPSFPSGENASSDNGGEKGNKTQSLILILVTLLFLITSGVLVFVLWKLL